MRQSDQTDKICAAIVAAQAEMPTVPKTATNPHFKSKFAPLDAIAEATGPVLAKHDLGIMQHGDGTEDGRVGITTRIVHTSGQWIEATFWMRPGKDDPQGACGCITYGSRYGYRMLGVVTDEDDDGNAASAPPKRAPALKAPPPATTAGEGVPGVGILTGTIAKCSSKTGTTKAGKEWRKYSFAIDTGAQDWEWVSTFSKPDATNGKKLEGQPVTVKYTDGEYGKELCEGGISLAVPADDAREPGSDDGDGETPF